MVRCKAHVDARLFDTMVDSGRRIAISIAITLMAGCSAGPVSSPAIAANAASKGLCLVQFLGGFIEIVPFNEPQRTYRGLLTSGSGILTWGVVSPDGTYLAARASPASANRADALIGITVDGHELWRVPGEFPTSIAISPDGQQIVFALQGQLMIYSVPDANLQTLGVRGQRPSWSPSGDRLAYDDGANVHIYDLMRQTTSDVGPGTEPSWSPHSEDVAVRAGRDKVDLVNLRTRNRRAFIDASYASVPRWSPDGEWMMYTYAGGPHWWSSDNWNLTEPHPIVIRDLKTGGETIVGRFSGKGPGEYTWVSNQKLCQMLG